MSTEFDMVAHQVVEETKEVEVLLQQLADSDAELCDLQGELARSIAGLPKRGSAVKPGRSDSGSTGSVVTGGPGRQPSPIITRSASGSTASGGFGIAHESARRLPSPGPLYPVGDDY